MDGCYQAGTQKRMEEATVAKAFFCLFSIMLYAKTVNPRFLFFLLRIKLFPTRRARPIQHHISSGQETSGIQLCLRLVSGDIHVTIRSFPSFCSFFPFFCVAAELRIPKVTLQVLASQNRKSRGARLAPRRSS